MTAPMCSRDRCHAISAALLLLLDRFSRGFLPVPVSTVLSGRLLSASDGASQIATQHQKSKHRIAVLACRRWLHKRMSRSHFGLLPWMQQMPASRSIQDSADLTGTCDGGSGPDAGRNSRFRLGSSGQFPRKKTAAGSAGLQVQGKSTLAARCSGRRHVDSDWYCFSAVTDWRGLGKAPLH